MGWTLVFGEYDEQYKKALSYSLHRFSGLANPVFILYALWLLPTCSVPVNGGIRIFGLSGIRIS